MSQFAFAWFWYGTATFLMLVVPYYVLYRYDTKLGAMASLWLIVLIAIQYYSHMRYLIW